MESEFTEKDRERFTQYLKFFLQEQSKKKAAVSQAPAVAPDITTSSSSVVAQAVSPVMPAVAAVPVVAPSDIPFVAPTVFPNVNVEQEHTSSNVSEGFGEEEIARAGEQEERGEQTGRGKQAGRGGRTKAKRRTTPSEPKIHYTRRQPKPEH